MYRILGCLTHQHDWRLVAMAGAICFIASATAIYMWRHATEATGSPRVRWLLCAGTATGFGLWSTHFIAMLAYIPGLPIAYALPMTLASLLAAVAITTLGLGLAVRYRMTATTILAGAVVGLGITVTHAMGMAGLILPGRIIWDPGLATLSVLFGIGFAAEALWIAGRSRKLGNQLLAGALFATAIAAHHVIGTSAITIMPDPTVGTGGMTISREGLALAIAAVAVSLSGACIVAVITGQNARIRIEKVTQTLDRALSNMSQGLCMFDKDERLVLANRRFAEILGMAADAFPEGIGLSELLKRVRLHHGIEPGRRDPFETYHQRRLDGIRSSGIMVVLDKDHVLSLTHSPMDDGFWVMTCNDVTSRLHTEQRISHLALHDSLTGLPNHTHLTDHLQCALDRAEEDHSQVALLSIDLDRFKEINDQHGHVFGDALLRTLSQRMLDIVRPGELFGRVGGDEFAAVRSFRDGDEIMKFLDRIEARVFQPVTIDGTEVSASAHIGIAIYPEDARTGEQLINNANLAMYRAKTTLGNSACFYEAEMDEATRARRAMIHDLWAAIDTRQFAVHYQVQKSLRSGEITGYEALVRWRHPELGMISPAEFIPLAEECGAIVKLGEWVLRQACIDAVQWLEPHKVAVNLSPVQLNQPDLPGLIQDILWESGMPADRLELEITETSIIGDRTRALHILKQIKALGISIAIDDFGTGYSSLDTLNAFPFDKIKIDRSFLVDAHQRPQSKAIIRAVLALGSSLGIPVLAEGIETEAQLDMLRREGCQEGQGYLFGKPMPPEAVERSRPDIRFAPVRYPAMHRLERLQPLVTEG